MRSLGRLCGTALLLSFTPPALEAQAAGVLLAEGVRAYRDLQFAAAAQLLRRALEPRDSQALSPQDRLRVLMYLGASEVFGEQRDRAVGTFRILLLTDPRFRPDSLIFPPRVTGVFDEVLQTTKAIALAAPREARIKAGDGKLRVMAYATSRHRMEATITSAGGDTVTTVHRGQVTDSLLLEWNGLDSAGSVVPEGSYDLIVASSLAPGEVLRSIRLPLQVTWPTADTLPWPPRPPLRTSTRWDLRVLIPGALLATGLIVPAAAGLGGSEGLRISLGIVTGAAGIIAARKPSASFDEGADADWRARVASVREENRRRSSAAEMVIRTGPPEFREGPTE